MKSVQKFLNHLLFFRLREESQPTEIDPEYRGSAFSGFGTDGQYCSVSAENDSEIDMGLHCFSVERRFRRARGCKQLNQLERAFQIAFAKKSLSPDILVA